MAEYLLPANDRTVRLGIIDPTCAPVLEVESGDEVDMETLGMWGDAVAPGTEFAEIGPIRQRFRQQGRGPHALTGPVAVRGAEPGMTLRVDVRALELKDTGMNLILPGASSRGLLADDFDAGEIRYFELDGERLQTEFAPGVTIGLRPFLGIMGVAPSGTEPRISSIPGPFGGNIDCPDLTVGSTLYLPVWAPGAGFYAGDAHAAQGCGEVCQTALETAMRSARLRLTVAPETSLQRPRAETGKHLITMGFDEDLRVAAQQAVRDMIDWLGSRHGLARSDAYALCSLQADLAVTQLVNGNNGIHARLPKSIFTD